MRVLVLMVIGLVSMIIFIDVPMLRDPFYRPSSIDLLNTIVLPLFLLKMLFGIYEQFSGQGRFITPLSRKIVVLLYTNGLVYHKGRKRQVVTWEAVFAICPQLSRCGRMRQGRGLFVDHTTVYCWGSRYAPELEKRHKL